MPEGSDQFNSLQEKLIDRFVELREQYGFQLLHLTCCRDTVEDRGTIQYLQDCATEAEIATEGKYQSVAVDISRSAIPETTAQIRDGFLSHIWYVFSQTHKPE